MGILEMSEPPLGITYYLSGPISGDIAGNQRKFMEACQLLRSRGYSILSPVEVTEVLELQEPGPRDWVWYMRRDIEAMMSDEVEGIIMLPGWEASRGARTELALAKSLSFRCFTYEEALTRSELVTV